MSWSFEGRYEPFLEHLKLNLLFQYILRNIAHLYVHILYIYVHKGTGFNSEAAVFGAGNGNNKNMMQTQNHGNINNATCNMYIKEDAISGSISCRSRSTVTY